MIARLDFHDGKMVLVLSPTDSTERAMLELHGAQFDATKHVDRVIGTSTWVIQADMNKVVS